MLPMSSRMLTVLFDSTAELGERRGRVSVLPTGRWHRMAPPQPRATALLPRGARHRVPSPVQTPVPLHVWGQPSPGTLWLSVPQRHLSKTPPQRTRTSRSPCCSGTVSRPPQCHPPQHSSIGAPRCSGTASPPPGQSHSHRGGTAPSPARDAGGLLSPHPHTAQWHGAAPHPPQGPPAAPRRPSPPYSAA